MYLIINMYGIVVSFVSHKTRAGSVLATFFAHAFAGLAQLFQSTVGVSGRRARETSSTKLFGNSVRVMFSELPQDGIPFGR
jgi:hypothetical protein